MKTLKISSESFEDGGNIPEEFTCDGEDKSPPLSIRNVPSDADSLALIVDDPDAPGGIFDHWLIWNLPADIEKIPEGVSRKRTLSSLDGAVQGTNDFGEVGYRGPCPPSGPSHRYRFKLFALSSSLDLDPGAKKSELQDAIKDKILKECQIVGKYKRR